MLDEQRETWSNQIDFFLSALGYAVGFGAIWRFPYLAFENGGGAFIIPYLVMFLVVGLPVFFIEMTLGQYSSSGPVRVYQNICPLFGGVGVGMVLNSFMIMLYYNMILAWTLYYLYTIVANIMRVTATAMRHRPQDNLNLLDWANCNPLWSSENCTDLRVTRACRTGRENTTACRNFTIFGGNNVSTAHPVSPNEDFFYNNMLEIGTDIDSWSWPVPQMLASLVVAWIIAFLCLARGLKMSGKIVWVTSTFPYLMLVVLLIRGAFLPGAAEGVRYFIQPTISYLVKYTSWVEAASMILFLLSVGNGGLSTYASYNKFHNNIYRDSILIAVLDVVASFLGGFCVFAYIGFIAHMLDDPVPAVTQEGAALLFIALPEATTQMPASVVWALALCLMMLMLGMDTQFAFVETCVTAIMDQWPHMRAHKAKVLFSMCLSGLLFGLFFTLKSGLFWLNLINYYIGGWPLMLFSLCEVVVVIIYGVHRLSDNLEAMTNKKFGSILKFMWRFVTPFVLLILLVLSCTTQPPLKEKGRPYPVWSQAVGWALAIGNVSLVPLYAVYALLTKHTHLNWKRRFKVLLCSTPGWQKLAEQATTVPDVGNSTARNGNGVGSDNGSVNITRRVNIVSADPCTQTTLL